MNRPERPSRPCSKRHLAFPIVAFSGLLSVMACCDDESSSGGGGHGTVNAGGTGGGSCIASLEICDLIDNDCDGAIDEDFPAGCEDPSADSDGDGLRDLWEVSGVDVDGDGTIDVDLPAMGANPLRKDAFLQVDWMEQTGAGAHSDRFSDEAMWRVQQAFLAAPVENPDGSQGITLHIDAGPDSIMDPLTMATWGALSLGKAIPHQDLVDVSGPTAGEFPTLRDAHMPVERRGVFRYSIAIHALAPLSKGGPCPEQLIQFNGYGSGDFFLHSQGSADSLLIALGGFDPNVQDVVQESAHFMHELGHTFGLRHGGTDEIHRKPNFLSVMNYSYSYRGLFYRGDYGTLDYSRFELPALHENMLSETTGIDPNNELADYGFIRFCGEIDVTCLADVSGFRGQLIEEPIASAPVDWNCNGMIDPGSVSAEIHVTLPHQFLTSKNEWNALDFAAGGIIGDLTAGGNVASAGASASASASANAEPELSDPLDAMSPIAFRVLAAGQGILRRDPGLMHLSFVVINRGAEPDVYALDLQTRDLEIVGEPLKQLSLAAGAHEVVRISVRLPKEGKRRARLRLVASSTANPKMASEASTWVE